MSSLIAYKSQLYTFREYCELTEGVVHIETSFGTDRRASDGKIGKGVRKVPSSKNPKKTVETPFHYAMFHHKGKHGVSYHAVVMHKNGEVGMGTHHSPSANITDYSDRVKHSRGDAIGTFGKSMHVLQQIADHTKAKKFHFNASDEKLGRLYHHVIKNKPFLEALAKHGWSYSHTDDDNNHHFKRT